eukprot:COSAG02_NODE_415_length_22762_cov_133.681816_7_plen_154_part_00
MPCSVFFVRNEQVLRDTGRWCSYLGKKRSARRSGGVQLRAKLSGFEHRSGVFKQLLRGRAVAADGAGDDTPEDSARDAGWNAIVGRRVGDAGPRPQPRWAEARDARGLTQQQAVASALTKLLQWHWSQPVAYLLVLGGGTGAMLLRLDLSSDT